MEDHITQFSPNDMPSDAANEYRQLPHNIEAEQGLLGALLINNDALDQIANFLQAKHFFDPVHQRIFESIAKLIANGNLASPVTLKSYLELDEGLAELGGASYRPVWPVMRRRFPMPANMAKPFMTWPFAAS